MIVESVPGLAATKNARRKKMEENRKKRREKLAAAKAKKTRKLDEIQDLSMLDLTIADSQPTVDSQQSQSSQASAPPSYSSQLPSYSSQPPSYSSQPSYDPTHSQSLPADHATSNPFTFKRANDTSETDTHAPKRARRTQSPSTARQEFAKKLSDRGRFRQGRYHERLNKMREERDRIFVEGLRAGFPPEWRSSSSSTGSSPIRRSANEARLTLCYHSRHFTAHATRPATPRRRRGEPRREDPPHPGDQHLRARATRA